MFDNPPSTSESLEGSTSKTLLERVRLRDPAGWRRFVHLYGPVIFAWSQRSGLQSHDAADVMQEVFQAVNGNITRFRHDHPGDSFRGWLRTITANKVRDHFRAKRKQISSHESLDDIPAPDPASFDAAPSPADDVAHRALELVQAEFELTTWQAFLACAVNGRTAPEAATELGLTVAAVYKAKSRVMHRLRRELEGLIE